MRRDEKMKWVGILTESFLDALQQPIDGYTMRNPRNGATITCTAQFVESWKERGFEIVSQGKITLMKPDKEQPDS